MDWVQIIKEVCEYQDWTPYKLSQESDISRGYINQLARGLQKNISIGKAMKILQYHPASWLITGGKIYKRGNENEGWVEV